jgi:protein gp37
MGDGSAIEWTDATWNPLRARNVVTGRTGHFCVHVSEGCRNCYAERLQPRFGNPVRYAAQDRGKVALFLLLDGVLHDAFPGPVAARKAAP